MFASKLYTEEWEIDARLATLGLNRNGLIDVIRATLAERSSSVDVDPLGARGTLAYIAGTRHLRWLLLPQGWTINRDRHVEATVAPGGSARLVYQNVDLAASPNHSPRAVAGKRAGSARVIEEAQGSLFSTHELPEAVDPSSVRHLHSAVWYLCVSFSEDDVRAELSLPASVKDGNFFGFLERIFLIEEGGWAGASGIDSENHDAVEIEPQIARR